jgi:putative endonuclease
MQAVSGKQDLKAFGGEGEDLAASFLKSKGFQVRERNYRCRLGEVDLIIERRSSRGRRITFVEVKTRRSTEGVSPRELISIGKQRHISRVAQHYLASLHLQEVDSDFAVLLIDFSSGQPEFEWIENAFDLAWGY